jgi:hypothetical protein
MNNKIVVDAVYVAFISDTAILGRWTMLALEYQLTIAGMHREDSTLWLSLLTSRSVRCLTALGT